MVSQADPEFKFEISMLDGGALQWDKLHYAHLVIKTVLRIAALPVSGIRARPAARVTVS